MDNIFIRRMGENRIWFLRMSLIYGGLFTVCLYRNPSGITFPLMTAVLLIFSVIFLKKSGITIQKGSIRYFAGIMLLGISTVMTDNGFFHFFNSVGIILLFMMVMAHQLYRDQEWGFTEYVKNFFIMVWTVLISVAEPFRSVEKIPGENKGYNLREKTEDNQKRALKYRHIVPVLWGAAAAVLMLLIVVPLLITSDRIFSEIFTGIFDKFNPINIIRKIDFWNIIGLIFTFIFGTLSLYAFIVGLLKMNLKGKGNIRPGKANPVGGITFTGILAAVYAFYSGIQILFLFMRLDTGLPDGITYSQYAHEGFWQLLFVSLINFGAVLICVRIFDENRILKMLLCLISVCTCIMIVSAAYRMMLYVNEYNLTFLRVLVLWFLTVLMIIFFGVIYSIYRKSFGLFRYMTAVVSVCYILLSFSRPDALIARYNIDNTEELNDGDLYYLTEGLSYDAASQIAELDGLQGENSVASYYLECYFEDILNENEDMGIRTWNYSRARATEAAESWFQE
nr:DUF4173 domain-containing protein [uncultured Mediterraneibacter sp.]